jgi:integrase/recombinase XerD
MKIRVESYFDLHHPLKRGPKQMLLAPVKPSEKLITDYSGSTSDDDFAKLWLYGKAGSTQKKYSRVFKHFIALVNKPLKVVTLADLHSWISTLAGQAQSTIKVKVYIIKSLFSFATKLGYVAFNVGAVVKGEKSINKIAQKCLPEATIKAMADNAVNERDRMIVRLGYLAGMRANELSCLSCDSLRDGIITFVGKGSKERSVKLPQSFADELAAFIGDRTGWVFTGRQKNVNDGKLTAETITRIVKKSAVNAGESNKISAHYLRHSHAFNALKNGANVALIRDTLGHSSLATTSQYLAINPDNSSAMSLSI